MRRLALQLLAAALGIVAFALVLTITDPPGPGLDPDAQQYLGAAESVAHHLRYRVPIVPWTSADSSAPLAHFPPAYPTFLAIPIRLGMEPMQAARLVDALAAFVTVTTLVLLVGTATNAFTGALLGVALMTMSAMLEVHVSVLSEPLFLASVAATLACMIPAPERPLRAGLCAALGMLTRYAGVSLVIAVVLWVLTQRGDRAERLRRVALAALPAFVLGAIWVVRTRFVGPPGAIRHFALYGDLGSTLQRAGTTVRDWLIPDPDAADGAIPHRGPIALVASVLLSALVLDGVRTTETHRMMNDVASPDRDMRAYRLVRATTLMLGCYLLVLVVSRVVADPRIPFDARILSPALLLATVLVIVAIARRWRGRAPIARIALVGAGLGWLAAGASLTVSQARADMLWGSDFASDMWRRSELLEWARQDAGRHPLFSNWPAPIYFYLHRPSHDLPQRRDARGIAAFPDTLRRRDGRVLVFDVPGEEFVTPATLRQLPGLHVVAHAANGVVMTSNNQHPR